MLKWADYLPGPNCLLNRTWHLEFKGLMIQVLVYSRYFGADERTNRDEGKQPMLGLHATAGIMTVGSKHLKQLLQLAGRSQVACPGSNWYPEGYPDSRTQRAPGPGETWHFEILGPRFMALGWLQMDYLGVWYGFLQKDYLGIVYGGSFKGFIWYMGDSGFPFLGYSRILLTSRTELKSLLLASRLVPGAKYKIKLYVKICNHQTQRNGIRTKRSGLGHSGAAGPSRSEEGEGGGGGAVTKV